jgi:hypothetical protein
MVAKWVQPEHYQSRGRGFGGCFARGTLRKSNWRGGSEVVVSAYEAGKRRVDVVEFLAIVRVLGADSVEIFAEIVRSLPK